MRICWQLECASEHGNAEHVDYLRLIFCRFSVAFTYLRIDSNCFIAFVTSVCKYCELDKQEKRQIKIKRRETVITEFK